MKRTSKHKKKLALRVEEVIRGHRVGAGEPRPRATICDALVGSVNAEHLAHGREVEEDEERRGWEYLRGEVFGAKMAIKAMQNRSFYWPVRLWKKMLRADESYRGLWFGEGPGSTVRTFAAPWKTVGRPKHMARFKWPSGDGNQPTPLLCSTMRLCT